MRGQRMNAAQLRTVERLRAKGWRGSEFDMFALAVPMYLDHPFTGMPNPCVVHVDRTGAVRRGYPRSKTYRGKKVG